ncbi:GGDEF domain-containing protein [Halomonas sp. SpR8]|uniref:GGDEF domain-containing protein n=1 Tax=Halomonas sp. SpR8 TaxID=3050463 RepID=UPI0027E4ED1A|nr:GGDEF domain-containing protein [Halomonas sp. SpR8]MDQ7729920.1 GGDEF domain-containing protein [Halomonas sp. SpR8]
MISRFIQQPGRSMAVIFAIILCAMSALVGSYVYNACQKASADYTSLISDVMLAQQAAPLLRAALEDSSRQANSNHIESISYFISLSQQHLTTIQSNIRTRSLVSRVEYLQGHFSKLDKHLVHLAQQLQEAHQRPELIDSLQRSAIAAGGMQAGLYSKLSDEIHALSFRQRLDMQRLSIAVSVLLVLVVSAAITLCLAVVHLHRQRTLMQQLMLIDELTGLYNRRHLVSAAQAALAQAQRDNKPLSLLLLDLDYFKQINDTYGHPTGDEVLRQISQQLRHLSRPSDTLARIGGEEFCLLMPNTTTHDALQVADRLRREIESNQLDGLALNANPTVSIGVTTGYGGIHTYEQLYCFADKALYQAKALGRNCVESMLPHAAPTALSEEKTYFPILTSQTIDF